MSQTLNVSGLKPEQIQAIIEAFKAKNQLDNLAQSQPNLNKINSDIIEILTENPLKVNGFLRREEIYER